jgi:hypothetical protein
MTESDGDLLHALLRHPKLAVLAFLGLGGLAKLCLEVYRDHCYELRVREHRRVRPEAKPAIKRPKVSELANEWERKGVKVMKGISRLVHARSLDGLDLKMSLRPGSKLMEPSSESAKRTDRPYRILSIDGGGVKGVFSLRILERLVAKFPHLLDDVDLIAGTSTGGLIALMLAHGYTPSQALEIYRHNIPIIFQTNVLRRNAPFLPTYADTGRLEVFQYYFDNLCLGDLGKYIIITAFRLDGGPEAHGKATFYPSGSWRPAIMSNLPIASGMVPPDNNLKCVAAAMRTTSAPTYFPIYQGYGDGGLFANNPSLSAIGRAYAHFPLVTPENTVVLSIGTGHNLKEIKEANGSTTLEWGLQQVAMLAQSIFLVLTICFRSGHPIWSTC